MRSIMVMLVMLAALLVGGWIGGETLIARSANRLIAADPRIESAGVSELREADRIGVRVNAPRFAEAAQDLTVSGDWADVWVKPSAPNEMHLALAPESSLSRFGRSLTLGPEGAEGYVRFSPSRGTSLSEAELTARDVSLDGQPALGGVTAHALLVGLGADSPPGTGAAYTVNGAVTDLSLAALTDGRAEGNLAASGVGRVWLSGLPIRALDAADGQIEAAPPRLTGLRIDGVELTLDDLSARVYGKLVPDENGLAQGEVLIDTADIRAIVQRAADMGMVPEGQVALISAAISAAAGMAASGTSPAAAPAAGAPAPDGQPAPRRIRTVTDLPPHVALSAVDWPGPREGERRVPLTFAGGQVSMAGLPLGPAPQIAPPAAASTP